MKTCNNLADRRSKMLKTNGMKSSGLAREEKSMILDYAEEMKEGNCTKDESPYEVDIMGFAKAFKIDAKDAYEEARFMVECLYDKTLILKYKERTLKLRWISSIDYYPDEEKIVLFFSREVSKFLYNIKPLLS